MDIAFGDCVSVGGFRYALILIDRATRYYWVYGLKDLSADSILSALCNFKADAGSYARCFRLDCDAKLFGKRIRDHLVNYNSRVAAAPAGRQEKKRKKNRLTGWSNHTGKQWCICPALILPKNKCHAPSGFSPSSTRHV